MHPSSLLVALTFLTPFTNALPPNDRRPDACAKAVASGPARPPKGVGRGDAAKSDCSSFLSKIVVPCPVTSTKISTSTKTARGVTKTTTTSTTITSTALVTAFSTVNSSVFSTNQQTQLTTQIIPVTSTALTTETTTTTSTVYETLLLTTTFSTAVVTSTAFVTSTLPALQKRNTPVSILPDRPRPTVMPDVPTNGTINARQQNNGQCRPATFTPDDVPSYASPCRDLKAYSTACQQLGVFGKTSTLQPSTDFVTRTSTTTTTPTLFVNITKTFQATTTNILTLPMTQLHTSITNLTTTQTLTTTSTTITTSTLTSLVVTNTTATNTLIASILATSTAHVTSTALATPSPSACSSFRLTIPPQRVGTYIRSLGAAEKMGFTSDSSLAAILSLDTSNRLFEPSTGLYPNTDAAGLYYVYLDPEKDVSDGGYRYFTCSVEKGKLECSAGEEKGEGRFWWCPVIGPPDALVWGTEAEKVKAGGWDCVELGVGVECV